MSSARPGLSGLSAPAWTSEGAGQAVPSSASPRSLCFPLLFSSVLPEQLPPNPLQCYLWFFSGDALCPFYLPACR